MVKLGDLRVCDSFYCLYRSQVLEVCVHKQLLHLIVMIASNGLYIEDKKKNETETISNAYKIPPAG